MCVRHTYATAGVRGAQRTTSTMLGSGDFTQVVTFGGKCFFLLSHLTGPNTLSLSPASLDKYIIGAKRKYLLAERGQKERHLALTSVTQHSVTVTKHLRPSHYKVHRFRDFGPWSLSPPKLFTPCQALHCTPCQSVPRTAPTNTV